MSEFNFFLPISKVEKQADGSVLVHGYASTPTLDLDGEIVSIDAVRKAIPGYWTWRNIREMHQPSAVGVAKEYSIDDKGWFLTSRVTDPNAAKKCLDEVYKGYSIGGKKLAKHGDTITDIELVEVSLVDRPANPDCRITLSKKAKKSKGAYLLKAGPPAARDGFSLPARPPTASEIFPLPTPKTNRSPRAEELQNNKAGGACEEHGIVGCPECMEKDDDGHVHEIRGTTGPPVEDEDEDEDTKKREFSTTERREAARRGQAMPGGGFPIKNKEDLDNARQAIGRAKNPGAARAHIRTRARALGVKLPPQWKKKEARKLIKEAERSRAMKAALSLKSPRKRTSYSLGDVAKLTTLEEPSPSSPFQTLKEISTMDKLAGSNGSGSGSDLDAAVLNIFKRGMQPTRAKRMSIAQGNLKKARKARKDAADEVKNCHAAISKRFMAKMAKAKKPPADDDDDDMAETEKVLKSLQKAYSALTTMKTFIRAASSQISKATSRSGQRGQEVSDSESGGPPTGAPSGLQDLSPGAVSRAGGGSEPPLYPAGTGAVYPGKLAKLADKNGMVPAGVAELMAENSRLEGQVALLGRVSSPSQRPYAFDMSKVYGVSPQDGGDRQKSEVLFTGVDPTALQSQDENVRNKAAAQVAGNYLLSASFGKSIVDPGFRGRAGMGKA